MSLVPIHTPEFNVVLDLRYGTHDNITGKPIYKTTNEAYLHESAAEKFLQASKMAQKHGLRFKIFDAFRPQDAQWSLWNAFPNSPYVADPQKGSPHTRGVAIDLTLVNEKGDELPMGTGFDSFEKTAHHNAAGLSLEIEHNRFLLLGLMSTVGFEPYSCEWWHYQLPNARNFDLINHSPFEIY